MKNGISYLKKISLYLKFDLVTKLAKYPYGY